MTATIDTYQPALALNQFVMTQGIYPSPSKLTSDAYLGFFRTYAGVYAPEAGDDVALANGNLLAISSNEALFSLLGTTYGGDGRTTFALPDLDGRTAVGPGIGPGLSPVIRGQNIGAPTAVIGQQNLPPSTGGTYQSFNEDEPGLGMNYVISMQGLYPSRGGGGTASHTIGEVSLFGGNFAPRGYAFCQGQLLPIAQWSALFSVLGTTYGGDGRTTFALPDLRGRTVVGASNDGSYRQGATLGQQGVTLTNANLPTEMGGGGQAVDNQEPSLVLNYLIATSGLVGTFDLQTATIGEINVFAGNFAPDGWLMCQGQTLAIASYPDLFAAIGTTYGGDGVTTFMLPDLQGRTVVGASDADGVGLGTELGAATFHVTLDHIPGLTYNGTIGNDALYGANENDSINGLAGDDSIRTWRGNDTLNGGDGGDVMNGGGGSDDLIGGDGKDRLIGSAGNDTLRGGALDDWLDGGRHKDLLIGGPGSDLLTGGADADVFMFKRVTDGIDTISDWTPGEGDVIRVDASGFGGGLTAGALNANQLVLGTAATEAFGQFLFDAATGDLSWDEDGTGGGAAVVLAHLMNGGVPVATLSVSDFEIIA